MDMSRDEINGRVDNRGGRGSRHRRRSGPIRSRDDVRVRSRRPVPYPRVTDIAHQRHHGGLNEGTEVFLSDLDSDLCGEDIEEMYGRLSNSVIEGTVHYDRSGVSLGTGTVTFETRADAFQAIRRADAIQAIRRADAIIQAVRRADELRPADRPRSMEIISPVPADTYSQGTGQNRRSYSRRGGRGLRGGRRERVERTTTRRIPTAQELDAELDAYSRETEEMRRRRNSRETQEMRRRNSRETEEMRRRRMRFGDS